MAGSKRKLDDHKWELCVSAGYDMSGKQIRKYRTITASSEKAADKELAKFYVEISQKPAVSNNKLTLRQFILVWQEKYHKTLEKTTQERNQMLLDKRILPALGNIKVQKLSDTMILRFIDELRQPGMRLDRREGCLSDRSIQMHYKLLHSILNKAVEWKYIAENPCDQIRGENIPKAKSKRLPILQDHDLATFLKAVESLPANIQNVKYKLMVSLSLITGARRGEFMALTWDCVDLANKRIYINKACEVLVNQPVGLKKPKTESSVRWLNIDNHTIDLLREHKYLQEQYLCDKGYMNAAGFIFIAKIHKDPKTQVNQAYPSTFYTWLRKFCAEQNLPPITTHSFRHMAASYALAYGVPLTTVQHMLGHTNIKTTAIYLHEIESKRKEKKRLSLCPIHLMPYEISNMENRLYRLF